MDLRETGVGGAVVPACPGWSVVEFVAGGGGGESCGEDRKVGEKGVVVWLIRVTKSWAPLIGGVVGTKWHPTYPKFLHILIVSI